MHRFASLVFALLFSIVFIPSTKAQTPSAPAAPGLKQVDEYTLAGDKHFVNDYKSRPGPGLVNVVVEIPSGTNAKWEVDKKDGKLKWEFRDGKPRIVKYLPYPGNYGMIPRTLLSKEKGGDGDPLDVIVLGPAQPRGSVIEARVIGVLKFLDGGEQDDKLLAVIPGTPLGNVNNFAQLKSQFNGVLEIVELWFQNYKGPGEMEMKGIGGVEEADSVLDAAIKSFEETAKAATSGSK